MLRLAPAMLCLLLAACAGDPVRAPVESRSGESKASTSKPRYYTVVRGDTLYAIAWRYGMDYRDLARLNGIDGGYRIYPGQRLVLDGSGPVAARSTRTKTPPPTPAKSAPAPAPRRAPPVKPSPPVTAVPLDHTGWLWPAAGKVVRKYSGTVHKGVDIAGDAGDPVKATAAGKVVYAGSGIVGYGRLLIVKHNELYLSAYGHNRRLLVAEGDDVSAGQQIAQMGSSATNSVKLHFEIRREGKPVDPLKLLPGR